MVQKQIKSMCVQLPTIAVIVFVNENGFYFKNLSFWHENIYRKLQRTLQHAEVLTFLEASATKCQLELSCHSLRLGMIIFTLGWLASVTSPPTFDKAEPE